MANTVKAERATITLGDIELEVWMKEDGEYFLSSTDVAKAIGKPRNSMQRFLESENAKPSFAVLQIQGLNPPEALRCEGLLCYKFKVKIDGRLKTVNAIPPIRISPSKTLCV